MPKKYGVRRRGRRVYGRAIANISSQRGGGYAVGVKKFKMYRSPNGRLTLLRKLPEISICSSGTEGVAVLNQTLSSGAPVCVTIGTPTESLGTTGTSVSYDIPFSLQFALSQIINHTDITNLADKYRIAGAYVRFFHNHTGSSGLSTASQPFLQYITDHDDSNVPTISQLREKMGVKFKTFKNQSSYVGLKCRPKPTRLIYSTALLNGYETPKYSPYLDVATDGIPHYGIKGVISNMPLPANAGIEAMKVDVTLLIQAKDFQ